MLAIVIPYRDRQEHLRIFFPRLHRFLQERQAGLAYEILLIEQTPGLPFNKGILCNVGAFLAQGRFSHFCIHDIDYVPIDVDYSPVDRPTRLMWHGRRSPYDYNKLFGGVVAFPLSDYELVNGHSNGYWGWGFEDTDLKDRFIAAKREIGYRDGTVRALMHPQAGIIPGVGFDETGLRNGVRYRRLRSAIAAGEAQRDDGLSFLQFDIVEDQPIFLASAPRTPVGRHIVVDPRRMAGESVVGTPSPGAP